MKQYKYGMNIFDGITGEFLDNMQHDRLSGCEHLIKIELNIGNAVELYYVSTNEPVKNYCGEFILTEDAGYCSIK